MSATKMSPDKEIEVIVSLCRQGRWQQALTLCLQQVQSVDDDHQAVLIEILANIYMATGRYPEAESTSLMLIKQHPDQLDYVQKLSELYLHQNKPHKAIGLYQQFLQKNPGHANGCFNLALLYKQQGKLSLAEDHYRQALALNIDAPEEVYTNMAVLYSQQRREQEAKACLEQALSLNPGYIPALFNLATLLEELGDKRKAVAQYQELLKLQPNNIEAQARLIHCNRVMPEQAGQLQKLQACLNSQGNMTPLDQEAGYFALGKGYDDLADYDAAFQHYVTANGLCKKRMPGYDAKQVERDVAKTRALADKPWVQHTQTASTHVPIFICGMFRSGTTLVEQVLSAHPMIDSGGELNLVRRCVQEAGIGLHAQPTAEQIHQFRERYQQGVEQLFPQGQFVTDKRPDNFWYLGIIKAAFPEARIICTDRHPLDICLSVFFQHLGNDLSYGASLVDTAHYYKAYKNLWRHWQDVMPENLFTLHYQQLILEPQKTIGDVLAFCGLPWHDDCTRFYQSTATVKTASIWQVRQPLYRHSLNRWQHYEKYLDEVMDMLAEEQPL